MGLDNGIVVKFKNEVENTPLYHEQWRPIKEYEVAYWRKCWNVREDLGEVFGTIGKEFYDTKLTPELLTAILSVLGSYNADNWVANNGYFSSIWEWDEISGTIAEQIANIKWLIDYWKEHPENIEECEFYDSY